MSITLVANGIGLSPLAFQPVVAGRSCLERLGGYAAAVRGGEGGPLLLLADGRLPAGAALPPGTRVVQRPEWNVSGLLAALREAAGAGPLLYVYADCPLLDPQLARRMLDNHLRYHADYTFADGYPYGLAPEILDPAVLPALAALAGEGGEPVRRDTLFELIRRDINAFDLETEISPEDLRLLRVSLTADTRRSFLLLERLAGAAAAAPGALDAAAVCRALRESPQILRTLPAFLEVQLVEGAPQDALWSPYFRSGAPAWRGLRPGVKAGEMPVESFERLAGEAEEFCGDAVIGVSAWGEAAWHDRFARAAAAVLGRPGLRLVVETSGLGWRDGVLEEVAALAAALPPGRRPDWIVLLDAWSPEAYRRVRGEGQEEARRTVDRLLSLFPGRVYVQAVRMKENEEDLETFYREWKKSAARPLVQKYDPFCGALPDLKVADLSPLKRFPCWHLKRDLHVRMDGEVPLCREDLGLRHRLGNVFSDGLPAVWAAQERFYREHLREEYPELCRSCDEYYTFNF